MGLQLTYTEDCPTFTIEDASTSLPGTYSFSTINIMNPEGNWLDLGQVSRVYTITVTGSVSGSTLSTIDLGCSSITFTPTTTTDVDCYMEQVIDNFNASTDSIKYFLTATYTNNDGTRTVVFTTNHPGIYFPNITISATGLTFSGSETTALVQVASPVIYQPTEAGGRYTAYLYYYDTLDCITKYITLDFYNFCYDYVILNCCMIKLANKTLTCRCGKYIPIAAQVREKMEASKIYMSRSLSSIEQGALAEDLIKSAKFLCEDCGCGGCR